MVWYPPIHGGALVVEGLMVQMDDAGVHDRTTACIAGPSFYRGSALTRAASGRVALNMLGVHRPRSETPNVQTHGAGKADLLWEFDQGGESAGRDLD